MNATLQDLMLNDRGFAFDPLSGETFQLSQTGTALLRLLQRGAEEEALLAHLTGEFEVDEHTARRDLDAFLRSLQQLGWLP